MKTVDLNIAENLRIIRKEKGLYQVDVAEILKTTQQQYSKYENGQNEVPIRHIITLCKFYNVSADWLLGLKDTRE